LIAFDAEYRDAHVLADHHALTDPSSEDQHSDGPL
jgi:hypothetical protein